MWPCSAQLVILALCTQGYSERLYPSVAWVCTNLTMGDDVDDDYDNWGMMMMWEMMEMIGWSDGGSNKMFMKLFKLVTVHDTLQI